MTGEELPRIALAREGILRWYDHDLRAHWLMPEATREEVAGPGGELALVRWSRPEVGTSTVLYSDLGRYDQAQVEEIVRSNARAAQRSGLTSYWKLHAHDEPHVLRDILASHGYVSDADPGDEGPVMVRDLWAAEVHAPSMAAADVQRVGADSLVDVARIEERIYGGEFGWLVDRLGLHLNEPEFLSIYVAYVDGQAACAGWMYVHPEGRFAALRGGGTVPEHRRKGLYAAVLWARLSEAARRGVAYAVVEPSPMNVPVVKKFAFERLTNAVDLVRKLPG